MNNTIITNCILDIYKIDSQVNAYEAYTEFWAEIMNALFCSFHSIKNKSNLNNIADLEYFIKYTELYINLERTYSFFQLTKTLDFMGLDYVDLYSNTKHSHILRENYKEKTSVLAYYILKCVLLNNYQGFLSWCDKHNSNLLNFKKTRETQTQFCSFIEHNYKSKSFIDNVNEYQVFLSNLKKKKGKKQFLLSNMRMSICELG